MRKRLYILSGVLLLTITALAQPRLLIPEYYLGVHGGVMASTTIFNPKVEHMTPFMNSVVLSGGGGLVFRYNGHKYCGVQVELNYMQRGWSEKNADAGVNYTRKLHYLELPLLMHIYFGQGICQGFFNLGPQVGYCIKDQEFGTRNPGATKQYEPINRPVDWGLAAGLGLGFRTPKAGYYELEARFNYSLGSVFSTNTADYFNQANPIDLSIHLAWMWEFKKKVPTKPAIKEFTTNKK